MFVHLHVHTHYSLLDGATRIEGLVARAKEFNMPAVAITDHGNMFGAIEFYNAAIKAGIKPIIGCEAYIATGDRRKKESTRGVKEAYHLLLLAMNEEGFRNLMRLSTIGYTEGFYRKPRIDKETLREYSAGLICTSTCIGGEIPQTLLAKDRAAAEERAKSYLEIFGPDRFFMELQDHGMDEQRMLNPELIDMANRLGVAPIATNDVHYLEHGDVEAHDILCCINTGSLVSDEDRFKFSTDQYYFKSEEEMAKLFPSCPEAISNTVRVAEMCNLELDLTKRHAPVFVVPDNISDDSGKTLSDAEYLRRLVYKGADERYDEITPELRTRIDYELEVITSKGFSSYFLIFWDCVNYAREQGIPVGARGSGCSAVVAYCLYISSPDPIRYGLYFERFMDPDRDEMPDIDLDICQIGRAKLLDYVREKYGHVAQIITFGTLKAKAVIKDVSRVMGLGFEEANSLTKLVPTELNMTLDKALDQEPLLKKRYEDDEKVKHIIDIGRKLEGIARNVGIHAAGVVVADKPLVNFLPLYKSGDGDALVTQFDGPTVERVGLLKMDFLGLRTLSTLERARQLAERSSGKSIDLEHIDLEDPAVYELFARGDTKGVFQFESGGMREVLLRIKPNRIEDLIAANALFRPGPMEYIPEYVKRKHGEKWTTPHPIMTEVLEETYGVMVYQEQVSRVVNRLGGIELKAAFRLAKAISKKKTSMIEAMREPFLDGCAERGVKRDVANQVFEDILKFGGYAFNKAHSTGYALVAFKTAWMKTYYPVEFMAAVMTFEMSSTEKVAEYREACREMGIPIHPPSINASEFDFVVERAAGGAGKDGATEVNTGAIRFGLGAIKGVGGKAVAEIVRERQAGGEFRDIFDLCERVDLSKVNRGTVEALICAGAFDETGAMRKALSDVLDSALAAGESSSVVTEGEATRRGMFDALDSAIAAGQSLQRDRRSGQMGLFGEPAKDDNEVSAAPVLTTAEWSESEMLAREKAVLGFYITRHPLASHEDLLAACATASTVDLASRKEGDTVIVGGMISSMRMVKTRTGRNAGKQIGIVTLEDLKGRVEAVLFSTELDKFRPVLVPDAMVFMEGVVDRKREDPSLRVSRVILAEKAAEGLAKDLILDVSPEADVEALAALLRQHSGEARVHFNVQAGSGLVGQVKCHDGFKACCSSELVSALRETPGVGHVKVLSQSKRVIPALPGAMAHSPA